MLHGKYTLKELVLLKGEYGDRYFRAIYEVDCEDGVYEMTIPKIYLPLTKTPTIHISKACSNWDRDEMTIDMGFGTLDVATDPGYGYTTRKTKDKTKEMTLEEIEKELGHKVKIVNK